MVPLNEIFDVSYGTKLDFRQMTECDQGVNFVTRSRRNLGISTQVAEVKGTPPLPAGSITVSLGGTYLLSAFVQPRPFYTAQNIKILTPLSEMGFREKVFYCACITANRFRYSTHGREANRSLDTLLVPSRNDVPAWAGSMPVGLPVVDFRERHNNKADDPSAGRGSGRPNNGMLPLSQLFDMSNGINASLLDCSGIKLNEFYLPVVRPSKTQTSSSVEFVDRRDVPEHKIFPKDTLYVSTNGQGSHTYAYVSTSDFVPNSDVTVLTEAGGVKMSLAEKLYYAACITANRRLFSYGRKPKGRRLAEIMLPASVPLKFLHESTFKELAEVVQRSGSSLT